MDDPQRSEASVDQKRRTFDISVLRRARWPFRRGHVISDTVKIFAVLMTLLCIFLIIWIRHIQGGLVRVPNDRFDNLFGSSIRWDSPSIWDKTRLFFVHNVKPVPIHSHNDYSRRIPLFEALGSGCVSVEADVHLDGAELLVGHSRHSTHKGSTLRTMYLEPLQRMLDQQNLSETGASRPSIFHKAPEQTVVLLVDIKGSGPDTFAELNEELEPLRDLDYLTYWNGTDRVDRPLTIVASGNAPFESVIALNETHRDIFWDAKLEQLPSIDDDFTATTPKYKYNQSNSYYASTQFRNARLYAWHDENYQVPTTPQAIDIEATQIDQAKNRGLIARYWDTPSGPPNLQNIVWRVLVDVKVGIINMDDMGAVRDRARGWGMMQQPL